MLIAVKNFPEQNKNLQVVYLKIQFSKRKLSLWQTFPLPRLQLWLSGKQHTKHNHQQNYQCIKRTNYIKDIAINAVIAFTGWLNSLKIQVLQPRNMNFDNFSCWWFLRSQWSKQNSVGNQLLQQYFKCNFSHCRIRILKIQNEAASEENIFVFFVLHWRIIP